MDVYLDTGQYGTHWSWEELEYRASLYKNCLEKWILKARRTSSSSGNSKYSHSRSPSTDSAIIHDEVVVRLHPPWHFTSAVASHFRREKLALYCREFLEICRELRLSCLGSLCLVVSFVFALTRYMGHRKRKNLTAKRKRLTAEEKTCQPLYALFYAVRTLIFRLPWGYFFCRQSFLFAVWFFLLPWVFS